MQEKLIFVISPPRSGSTLLQRMLGSHSAIFTHPEPHLITPLAYLGYHDTVDKAPYDHINAAEAIRLFVDGLPNKEQDYLEALQNYTDTMYEKMLSTTDCSMFLDKTPAYGLVLPFLTKLYPQAKYVVLTRHPLAVFSSYANSFFNGDWRAAREFNPVIERYVPAIARLLRENDVPLVHVKYEELVRQPAEQLENIFSFLGLPNEPEAVEYGKRFHATKGRGDPISVEKHDRPVEDSIDKWAAELKDDAKKLTLAQEMIDNIDAGDLETWGTAREHVFDALGASLSTAPPKTPLNAHTIQRRVMLALKKDIHERPHGRLLKTVRYYCDVLLRE